MIWDSGHYSLGLNRYELSRGVSDLGFIDYGSECGLDVAMIWLLLTIMV